MHIARLDVRFLYRTKCIGVQDKRYMHLPKDMPRNLIQVTHHTSYAYLLYMYFASEVERAQYTSIYTNTQFTCTYITVSAMRGVVKVRVHVSPLLRPLPVLPQN